MTTKVNDKVLFLVEAKQAGIFEIRNLPPEQMSPIMGIACPQIVYPYLRGNVAGLYRPETRQLDPVRQPRLIATRGDRECAARVAHP